MSIHWKYLKCDVAVVVVVVVVVAVVVVVVRHPYLLSSHVSTLVHIYVSISKKY